MSKTGKLVVVSGPSGVGKSSLLGAVRRRCEADFSVSATTRRPRAGEVDGQAYRFVDRATFEQMIADGELLEWAEVFDQYYGTPAGPVEQAVQKGRTILLDIDVQGGLQVYERMPEATFVLVVPPSREELARRLAGRGSEQPEDLAKRLAKADEEIAVARASGAYKHEVVNDDLTIAADEMTAIVTS